MDGQRSIPKHKITRAASLAATGAKVGANYLRHLGKRKLGTTDNDDLFHEQTAKATYDVFSKLKGGPLKVAQMLSLDSDLRMIKPIALRLFKLDAATLDPYITEVRERLIEETDYRLELRRSQEFAKACSSLENTRFPNYYPELSSERVLTMDWVDGMHLDQFASSGASQAERDREGQLLWDFYHYQVHELGTFHADPHPGNFIVSDGELWVLDFGCVKSIQQDFNRAYFGLYNLAGSLKAKLRTALPEFLSEPVAYTRAHQDL